MSDTPEDFGRRLKLIADRLSSLEQVSRFDTPNEPQGYTLAHDFLDLAESFAATLILFNKLERGALGEEALKDLLHDIGEQLRHIRFHLDNSRYYDYLRSEAGF